MTIATYRARLRRYLQSTGSVDWKDYELDDAIREALDEYSRSLPSTMDAAFSLPGDGLEVALDSLANLTGVFDVHWPYDTLLTTQPTNLVTGFRLVWDDARPVLLLTAGGTPQQNDEIYLTYGVPHTIYGLDGADITTIPPVHETIIIEGAGAYATISRIVSPADPRDKEMLRRWAYNRLMDFRGRLAVLRPGQTRARSSPWGEAGWKADRWDST